MELTFIDLTTISGKSKATIHITGKLGLSSSAANLMHVDKNSYFKLATDKLNRDVLYLVPADPNSPNKIKASKAGQYYYFNIAKIFDDLAYDCENHRIGFLIESVRWEGKEIFQLTVNYKTKRS